MVSNLFDTSDERVSLYGGDLVLYYNNILHTYWSVKNGEALIYPSLTTILSATIDKSAPLMQWAVNEALKEASLLLKKNPGYDLEKLVLDSKFAHKTTSTAATDTGSIVHDWVCSYWSNESLCPPMPQDSDACRSIEAFLEWVYRHKVRTLFTEKICASKRFKFAGRNDWFGFVDDRLTVADWKSSKRLYDPYRLQLAGYARAIKEEIAYTKYISVGSKKVSFPYDQPIDRMVVRLGKDGVLEYNHLVDKKELKSDITALLHATSLYRWIWRNDNTSKKKLAALDDIRWCAKYQETTYGKKIY